MEDFTGIAVTTEAVSVPPEWAPQKAIWTAWPADPDEWNGDLASPRRDVAGLVRALSRSNRVRVLVDGIPATFPDGQTTLNHVDISTLGRAVVVGGAEIRHDVVVARRHRYLPLLCRGDSTG